MLPAAEEFRNGHTGQSCKTGRVPESQGGICHVGRLKDERMNTRGRELPEGGSLIYVRKEKKPVEIEGKICYTVTEYMAGGRLWEQ